MQSDNRHRRYISAVAVCILCAVICRAVGTELPNRSRTMKSADLLAHDNLFVWQVSIDSKKRSPEESAQMLERLGIKQLGYSWEDNDVASFDDQIETFKRHGIRIIGWIVNDIDRPTQVVSWKNQKNQGHDIPAGVKSPGTKAISVGELLEMFKRHHINPQLWLRRPMQISATAPPLEKPFPTTAFSEWPDDEKNRMFRRSLNYDMTTTQQEWSARVNQEADHVKALAEIAASYGVKVALYKHGGWIGVAENQVAVVKRLEALGITNVGIVYQFVHAHDESDDTADFRSVWIKMRPYVLAVNITGLRGPGTTAIWPILYPGQGDAELGMISIIQESGWKGPIGISPEKGGDAESTLRNNLIGVDWIAAKLTRHGSEFPPHF